MSGRPKLTLAVVDSNPTPSRTPYDIETPFNLQIKNTGKATAYIQKAEIEYFLKNKHRKTLQDLLEPTEIMPNENNRSIEPNNSVVYTLNAHSINIGAFFRRTIKFRPVITDGRGNKIKGHWQKAKLPAELSTTYTIEDRSDEVTRVTSSNDNFGAGVTSKSDIIDTANFLIDSRYNSTTKENLTIVKHTWRIGMFGIINDFQTRYSLDAFLNNFNAH